MRVIIHDLDSRYAGMIGAKCDRAVAADGCVASPTSGEFLSRHGFKSHSTVRSALADLVDNDLLYRTDDGYVVYDRLFGIWLSRL